MCHVTDFSWMMCKGHAHERNLSLLHVILQHSSIDAAAYPLSDAMLSAVQAFVQKLAVCLLDVDRDPTSPMVDQMNNWTAEATCFVSCPAQLHISDYQSEHGSALSPARCSSKSNIALELTPCLL